MLPRSFRGEVRIALIEPITSSTKSSTSLGQLLASARFTRDQTPFIGVELRSIRRESVRYAGGYVVPSRIMSFMHELVSGPLLIGSGRLNSPC
jgi:hypothetical protein